MRYSDKLLAAVREQNVVLARTAILSYLDSDATAPMPQALRFAEEIAGKFTDPEDPFFDRENHLLEIPPKSEWDPVLLRQIKAALQTNFSREKLELAEQVIAHLRRYGVRDFQVKRKNPEVFRPVPGVPRRTAGDLGNQGQQRRNTRYSDNLQTAIREQNVVLARTAILSYLDSDATAPMPQALRFAEEIAGKFTDPEDPFFDRENHLLEIPPKSEWDPVLLRQIKAALQTNFSREKLELAEQVIAHLRRYGVRDFQVKAQNLAPRSPQGRTLGRPIVEKRKSVVQKILSCLKGNDV